MDAVVAAADRVGAWIVSDEIYRGAELDTDETSPTFWGRYDKVVITSGLSKAFAMPGLRVGWIVAPADLIPKIWERHDYTTLTPSSIGDRLAGFAMQPVVRENILLAPARSSGRTTRARRLAPGRTTTSSRGHARLPARSCTRSTTCR